MSGYPQLFPSGFLEFQDNCQGPLLYRNQPSRESQGIRLNDFMNKYVTGEYKEGDFIRMATNLKQITRTWKRLPDKIKSEFLKLIKESDSALVEDLMPRDGIERFGDGDPLESATQFIEEMKDKNPEYENIKVVRADNRMSILIIIVVAIVAVVIGFLIAQINL